MAGLPRELVGIPRLFLHFIPVHVAGKDKPLIGLVQLEATPLVEVEGGNLTGV